MIHFFIAVSKAGYLYSYSKNNALDNKLQVMCISIGSEVKFSSIESLLFWYFFHFFIWLPNNWQINIYYLYEIKVDSIWVYDYKEKNIHFWHTFQIV